MRDVVRKYKVIGGQRFTLYERYYEKYAARALAKKYRESGLLVRVFNVPRTHEYRIYARVKG